MNTKVGGTEAPLRMWSVGEDLTATLDKRASMDSVVGRDRCVLQLSTLKLKKGLKIYYVFRYYILCFQVLYFLQLTEHRKKVKLSNLISSLSHA